MADRRAFPFGFDAGIIVGLFCFVCVLGNADAKAQTIYFGVHDIALKSGESAELGDVYYITHDNAAAGHRRM